MNSPTDRLTAGPGCSIDELTFRVNTDYMRLISEEVSSVSRKSREMHHSPARPTRVKIILLNVAACPPKSQPTKSNLKSPTEPQFRAPMITSISEVLSSILSSPEINSCAGTLCKHTMRAISQPKRTCEMSAKLFCANVINSFGYIFVK